MLRASKFCRGCRLTRRTFSTAASAFSSLRERIRSADLEAYLTGSLLPSHARDSFFTMRALSLELEGVREGARGNATMGHARMTFWRDLIRRAFAVAAGDGGMPAGSAAAAAHPLFEPLARSVARHGHSRRWLDRLVDAHDNDLDGPGLNDPRDLEALAEATESSLLYLSLEACGVRDPHADRAASHVGRAKGIAAVLRTLPSSLRTGRLHLLPLQVLKAVRARAARCRGLRSYEAHPSTPPYCSTD
jgi:NADH dehydrogenase [ubiquinone] 1 alpha subcomplex assembly factor 6